MKKGLSKILNKIEEKSSASGNPYWIISHETGEFLNKLIRDYNMKRVLEVGTSIGYSGIWIAEALTHTEGKLYTIESHEGRFEMAKENFYKAGLQDYIVQLKGHAPDVSIPDMFDLLFLDATKAEYVSYINTFLFHMKKGGMIVADNALSHEGKLSSYKKYLDNSPYLKTELHKIGTGIYVSTII